MKHQMKICGASGRVPSVLFHLVVFVSALFISFVNISAQEPQANMQQAASVKKASPVQTRESMPFFREFRKITIGSSSDELRDAWGKPDMEFSDGVLYMSDSESIQIAIDPEKKIRAIAVTFIKGQGAPSFAEVFGEGATPENRENGSVYKLVRYRDAGYWVAYSAGSGDDANISVTMQKL